MRIRSRAIELLSYLWRFDKIRGASGADREAGALTFGGKDTKKKGLLKNPHPSSIGVREQTGDSDRVDSW